MPGATVTNTIIDVWQENLEEEFAKMRETVLNYHYIAMVRCILQYVMMHVSVQFIIMKILEPSTTRNLSLRSTLKFASYEVRSLNISLQK